MDLLGSILGTMEKPPSVGDKEKKLVKEQKARIEKQQKEEKDKLEDFRESIQKKIHDFIKDGTLDKYAFKPMDKVLRAILHEVADDAGLTSFSFGLEEQDRYVMVWKKEFAPSDEEIAAYRRDEKWDPEQAKEIEKQKELMIIEEAADSKKKEMIQPPKNYKDKYKHLIGEDSAKDAAHDLTANTSYGFVPSANKRDLRTIEQVMADTKARKKQKTDANASKSDGMIQLPSEVRGQAEFSLEQALDILDSQPDSKQNGNSGS